MRSGGRPSPARPGASWRLAGMLLAHPLASVAWRALAIDACATRRRQWCGRPRCECGCLYGTTACMPVGWLCTFTLLHGDDAAGCGMCVRCLFRGPLMAAPRCGCDAVSVTIRLAAASCWCVRWSAAVACSFGLQDGWQRRCRPGVCGRVGHVGRARPVFRLCPLHGTRWVRAGALHLGRGSTAGGRYVAIGRDGSLFEGASLVAAGAALAPPCRWCAGVTHW